MGNREANKASYTRRLHNQFIADLGNAVIKHSEVNYKPLEIDLRNPFPPRLRAYVYSLVEGGKKTRLDEFKAVLRVPGQKVGQYGSFDFSPGRLTVLLAYCEKLELYVFWEAILHPRFKNGGNVQVKKTTIWNALSDGIDEQERKLTAGGIETVTACTKGYLAEALNQRLENTPPG